MVFSHHLDVPRAASRHLALVSEKDRGKKNNNKMYEQFARNHSKETHTNLAKSQFLVPFGRKDAVELKLKGNCDAVCVIVKW